MKAMKFNRPIKTFLIVMCCLLLFSLSIYIPTLSLEHIEKHTDVRRDRGVRGIISPGGNNTIASIYVTSEELDWYRNTTDFWITPPEPFYDGEHDIKTYVIYKGKILQIGQKPVTDDILRKRYGDNVDIQKIIPKEEFYEIQVSFDLSKETWAPEKAISSDYKQTLKWITSDKIEYAMCRVYCKGVSVGNTYDHIWGKYAKPEGYLDLNP